MKKFLMFIILFLLFSCLQNGTNDYIDEIIIDSDGEHLTLRWIIPNDKYIKGFIIYWGEIVRYRIDESELFAEDITPPHPPHMGLGNTFKNEADVGYTNCVSFRADRDKFYQFYLRAYDKNRELSPASKVKYWPQNPYANNIQLFTDPWHGYLHKNSGPVTVSWDDPIPEQEVVRHEVKVEFINDDEHITTYQLGETSGTEFQSNRPGPVGLYKFFVRACDALNNCSTWTSSDDSMNSIVEIDGVEMPGNWIVYWMLSVPTWE